MDDDAILITQLNDFIFCPASIYFHQLYGETDNMLFQDKPQIDGKNAHKTVDNGIYSSRKNILQGISVYSEKYNLMGKIDLYDADREELIERKKKIKTIYDGYVFQIYAQYFALVDMGYKVNKLFLYSMDDNKKYEILLPCDNLPMFHKFEQTIMDMRNFKLDNFVQTNIQKCEHCIYAPACDRVQNDIG